MATSNPRVLLVSLEPVVLYVYGVRSLSAVLNANGYDTRILFFFPDFAGAPPPKTVAAFLELCGEFDVIGFSFCSSRFALANSLTSALRKRSPDKLVVFGGTDPTMDPERNLKVADIVCVGEAEESFLKILKDPRPTTRDSQLVTGPLRTDFPKAPTPDNNFERHYIYHKGKISNIKGKIARQHLGGNYMTMTSFGCPMECSYCVNNRMKKLYPDWGRVRHRPVDHILAELKDARQKLPRIWSIDIVDDDFCSASIEYLAEFRDKYKKEINLPLDIMGIRPADVTAEKLDLLKDMGAVKVRMGIQAVDQGTKKLFKRNFPNELILEKTRLINKYRKTFYAIRYDFIVDTPWDGPEASAEVLKFIARMPRPFQANIYTLAFFPGTELYAKAVQEGIIKEADVWEGKLNENFMELKNSWVNFLLVASNLIPFSERMTSFLLKARVRSVPKGLFRIIQLMGFAKRWIWYVLHGDVSQIRKIFSVLEEYKFMFKKAEKA